MSGRIDDVHAAVALTILERSFPDQAAADRDRVAATVRFVQQRISTSSSVMRLGAMVGGLLLRSLVRASCGRPARDQELRRQHALDRWIERPLPIISEYSRMVRSLTLVGWFDLTGHETA